MKKRGVFNLGYNHKLSFKMGQLVPLGWIEVNPGDSMMISSSALLRLMPLNTPVMHQVQVDIWQMFVPLRIIWDDFEDFITGGPDGMNASVHPYIEAQGVNAAPGTLLDYLGVKTERLAPPWLNVSAHPVRAYQLIVNECFRDQDLVAERAISKASGLDVTTDVSLFNAAWEKDRFTSARPWTQKGPDVSLPLGTTAPVVLKSPVPSALGQTLVDSAGNPLPSVGAQATLGVGDGGGADAGLKWKNGGADVPAWMSPDAYETDLTGATAVEVNQLRLALALQRYEEARARWGSRYTEYLRYLGVRSSDARLQRPELIAHGRNLVQFSEVLSTSSLAGEPAPGQLYGHGIGVSRSNRALRFFEEHGVLMTLCAVRPRTSYMQGTPRRFFRTTKEDYHQQELEHIGQAEVRREEVYSDAVIAGPFGYQDRYDEFRHTESYVSGLMRTSLKTWHMSREFAAEPELNDSFVTSTPTTRVFQDTTGDNVLMQVQHSIKARRLLSQSGRSFIF